MGLLSFLTSRRIGGDRAQESSLKYQAYDGTVASHLPIRGKHAVCGNGPVSLEQLRRAAARKTSQPQLSVPAKPFLVGLNQRPSSAPNDDFAGPGGRPRADTTIGFHQLALMDHGRGRRLHRFDVDNDTESLAPSIPSSVTYTSGDGDSSAARLTRHIDILDAQGGIKPCDFKTRIHAAGARDYGEDVADRNMEPNGVDRPMATAQAYCAENRSWAMTASSIISEVGGKGPTAAGSDLNRASSGFAASQDEFGATDAPWGTRVRQVPSVNSTMLLSNPTTITSRSSSRSSRQHPDAGTNWRKGAAQISSHEPAWSSRGRISAGRRQAERSRDASPDESICERSDGAASPPPIPRYRPQSTMSIAAEHSQLYYGPASSQLRRQSTASAANRASATAKSATRRDRQINLYALHSNNSLVGRRRSRLGELDTGGECDDDCWPEDSASACHVSMSRSRTWSQKHRRSQWNSPWTSGDTVTPSEADDSACNPVTAMDSVDRSWSCASANGATLDDSAGCAGSSRRHGSMSSATATTELSGYSSNAAARPHSIRTANTSIDFAMPTGTIKDGGMTMPVSSNSSSRHGDGEGPASAADVTAQEEEDLLSEGTTGSRPVSRGAFGRDQTNEECDSGSSDDSDVDSFVEKRQTMLRAPLRSDGGDAERCFEENRFGDFGKDLPGLHKGAGNKPCLMCSLLQCASIDPPFDAKTGTWAEKPRCDHKGRITQRDRLRALGYEYDTDDDADGISESEPERIPRGRIPTKRTAVASSCGRYYGAADACEPIDELAETGPGRSRVPRRWRERRMSKARFASTRRLVIEPVPEDVEEGHAGEAE
ncbi:hypothetical protein RJ55_04039 [Drechmeria coniospora]|nr:hypothetical protein RJ55_04039 [Drechmeria coniospora]